tara:strand:+ start:4514 stop:5065 length:552 start_codon:yes stop_codon:yes gene_type:complete
LIHDHALSERLIFANCPAFPGGSSVPTEFRENLEKSVLRYLNLDNFLYLSFFISISWQSTFLVAMNNNTKRGFGRALKHRLRDEGWSEERLDFNSTPLLNAILRKHKPVEHLLFNKEISNHCTYLEAMLVAAVLSHYLDWKVPVLPMHDGVITTVRERDRLKNVMEFEAERLLTSAPIVVVEY